ncbi:MAG: hypothetical protein ACOVRE_01825, partial [Sediminibacterium sp.]
QSDGVNIDHMINYQNLKFEDSLSLDSVPLPVPSKPASNHLSTMNHPSITIHKPSKKNDFQNYSKKSSPTYKLSP